MPRRNKKTDELVELQFKFKVERDPSLNRAQLLDAASNLQRGLEALLRKHLAGAQLLKFETKTSGMAGDKRLHTHSVLTDVDECDVYDL